jgi:excisionase family DNA binding protein
MAREAEPHPDDLMTTGEAARVLGLSTDMVRLLERDGLVRAQRTTNGLRLFRRRDVEKLAAKRARVADKKQRRSASPGGAARVVRRSRGSRE